MAATSAFHNLSCSQRIPELRETESGKIELAPSR